MHKFTKFDTGSPRVRIPKWMKFEARLGTTKIKAFAQCKSLSQNRDPLHDVAGDLVLPAFVEPCARVGVAGRKFRELAGQVPN
jgi:hypothetical protein